MKKLIDKDFSGNRCLLVSVVALCFGTYLAGLVL